MYLFNILCLFIYLFTARKKRKKKHSKAVVNSVAIICFIIYREQQRFKTHCSGLKCDGIINKFDNEISCTLQVFRGRICLF